MYNHIKLPLERTNYQLLTVVQNSGVDATWFI